ncbi:MAG: glycosyltransferase [Candidatus Verstraetearchaeota archaeon]|nr:glycosyltransferase [Candidatus Verstraetearchaeota archaeon]
MRKTKILFVLGSLGGGGAERVTLHLLRHLDRRRFILSLALLKGPDDYISLLPDDVNVHRLGVRARYAVLPLARLIRSAKPDIVFSTSPHVDQVLCLAVKFSRHTPEIVLRSPNYPSMSLRTEPFYVRRLAKWSYHSADTVIALTHAMKENMIHKFGLSPQRIAVIPNPVDVELIQALSKQSVVHPWFQKDEKAKHPLVISMGRLELQKGFKYLLEAFAKVTAKFDARLVILGKGSQINELKKLGEKLGITSRLAFLGFQKNPYKYLARADLFVLASLWEGFPNALVEAMACGIPVVSTDCPSGPSEILSNGEYGSLVPCGDSMALAEAIEGILSNKEKAAMLAAAGQKRANDFCVTRIIAQYEKLFSTFSTKMEGGRSGSSSVG